MQRQRSKKAADDRRDERFRVQGLIPVGRIGTMPNIGRKVEAGLVERVLPESIYSALIVMTLDGRGTCVELVTRILPLLFVLLLALSAQLMFAIYLDRAVWIVAGDLGDSCTETQMYMRWVATFTFVCVTLADAGNTLEIYEWLQILPNEWRHRRLRYRRYELSGAILSRVLPRECRLDTPLPSPAPSPTASGPSGRASFGAKQRRNSQSVPGRLSEYVGSGGGGLDRLASPPPSPPASPLAAGGGGASPSVETDFTPRTAEKASETPPRRF